MVTCKLKSSRLDESLQLIHHRLKERSFWEQIDIYFFLVDNEYWKVEWLFSC